MKINPKQIVSAYVTPQTKSVVKHKTETNATANVDKIEVSQKAKEQISLQEIKQQVTSQIETSYSKPSIERVKADIASGTYTVNKHALAQAMIDFATDTQGENDE